MRTVVFGLGLLAASQVLIFPPGTDVSPYAAYNGGLTPNTYGGATVQVWAILLLLATCGIGIIRSSPDGSRPGAAWTMTAVATTGIGGVLTSSSFAELAEGVGKLLLPLLLLSYLSVVANNGNRQILSNLVISINVFTVGQAIVCKLITGKFSSNTYYIELPEEYFGYFYHPFAFVGIVSACTVVVLDEFVHHRRRFAMGMLLLVNIFFIFETQVRTYILATAVAFLVAAVGLTIGKKNPLATLVAASGLSAVALLVGRNLVAGSRVTSDASSGRLDRWATDVQYAWSTASTPELLLGGGPGRVFDLNQLLFGVHINSLNAAIDIFVDFGILGLVTILGAWITLVRHQYRITENPLLLAIVSLLAISAAVTNPLEFPAVGAVLVIAMLALRPHNDRPVALGAANVQPGPDRRRIESYPRNAIQRKEQA